MSCNKFHFTGNGLFITLHTVGSLTNIYKQHVYGIIGTLVFHILLVGFFLLAEIRLKDEMKETVILIEIPAELMEINETALYQESSQFSPISNAPSSQVNIYSAISNQPSNRGITVQDKFFDENYQREINEARKLVSDVNNQLSKEIIDPDKIIMPEDLTEGRNREEIRNIVYSGESNIEYSLENRYHIRLPIPVYLARGGGIVTVDITVNREGKVISARLRTGGADDEQINFYARTAALRTVFNSDLSAPVTQDGTIRYIFIPQ